MITVGKEIRALQKAFKTRKRIFKEIHICDYDLMLGHPGQKDYYKIYDRNNNYLGTGYFDHIWDNGKYINLVFTVC